MHCAADILHTIAFGPAQRWTSATVWIIILANPWGTGGPKRTRVASCIDMLDRELRAWYETASDEDQILGELSARVLGGNLVPMSLSLVYIRGAS